MSNREYEMRLAWIDKDMDEPSKLDQYLMRIIQFLDAIWGKRSSLNAFSSFRLKFGPGETEDSGQDRQTQSRKAWSVLGKKANGN